MSRLRRDGTAEPVSKFSGTHGDRGIFIFPVQLTTNLDENNSAQTSTDCCTVVCKQTVQLQYVLCVYACVFIKLHITTQSGPVILVILCHSH